MFKQLYKRVYVIKIYVMSMKTDQSTTCSHSSMGVSDSYNSNQKPRQDPGNYNAKCNTCGQITAVNVETKEKAFQSTTEHIQNSACSVTTVEMIKPQEDPEPEELN